MIALTTVSSVAARSLIVGFALVCLSFDAVGAEEGAEEGAGAGDAAGRAYPTVQSLGEALFFDVSLSKNRTQSCATCHDPELAFSDPNKSRAVSLGDDGVSLGDRTAPMASYAAFVPDFHRTEDGAYVGGLFWDGRASGLEQQAGEPVLNPIEMAMPDKASVVARLAENASYVASMKALFSNDVFEDTPAAYTAMTQALAAHERSELFSPFDSKYDRFLQGRATLSPVQEQGRALFFSRDASNCNRCHLLGDTKAGRRETFTNHQYRNTGVPVNKAVRAVNGLGADHVDIGLLGNPAVTDPKQRGRFRVPSLRNVAVTGPYMRNGLFQHLETAVRFYNRYNSLDKRHQTNPETGLPWGKPEVAKTLSFKDLTHGPVLKDDEVAAIVAFLKTLTDARYEGLLRD